MGSLKNHWGVLCSLKEAVEEGLQGNWVLIALYHFRHAFDAEVVSSSSVVQALELVLHLYKV